MKRFLVAALFASALLTSVYAIATVPADHTHADAQHSGGTDAYGCHHDHIHGGYHCH